MKRLATLVLIVILVATTIFIAGCSCFFASPQPYGPRVTGDGTGGAIVVYEDIKGGDHHDFYVQKISPEGKTVWGDEGILVGGGYKKFDSYHDPHIVSDGSGGALVFWHVWPSDQQQESVSHITSVDSRGNVRWQREVRWADYMISDGAGGAIIATDSSYDERTLFMTKLDSDGGFPWGEDGVMIGIHNKYSANSLELTDDETAGTIVTWQEFQSEPGPEPHRPIITHRIYAQRINAEGSLAWRQEGVLLYATPEGVYSEGPKVTSDGSGGAIAIWQQVPRGRIESGSPEALLMDVYVQKIDASGSIFWKPNGLPLEINKAAESAFPMEPKLASDGSGGAIIIWRDSRDRTSLYAQKIDADGSVSWQPDGVKVASTALNPFHSIVSNSSGGAIVSYHFSEDGKGLYVQKLGPNGRVLWEDNGVAVTGSENASHFISSDGQGGVIIALGVGKGMFSSEKAFVQRVSADGKLLWGEKGIRLK
jgi:hypothetical protein